MKKTLMVVLCGVLATLVQAQNLPVGEPEATGGTAASGGSSVALGNAGLPYYAWNLTNSEIGPNHEKLSLAATAALAGSRAGGLTPGQPVQPQGRVTVAGSGLNYWDKIQQAYVRARPAFRYDASNAVFVADQVQHQTRIDRDLYVSGAVRITVPQGSNSLTLRSTPVAIGLREPDGRFEVIAGLTNCTGVQVRNSTNELVFPDAFRGSGVCADIWYRIEDGSFSQSVLFTGKLDPADYGCSSNAEILILTEFFGAPEPVRTGRTGSARTNGAALHAAALAALEPPKMLAKLPAASRSGFIASEIMTNIAVDATTQAAASAEAGLAQRLRHPAGTNQAKGDVTDQTLRFGPLIIKRGVAYTTPSAAHTNGTWAPVHRSWTNIDGRTYLIEAVSAAALAPALRALPDCRPAGAVRTTQFGSGGNGYASIPVVGARLQASTAAPAAPEMAQAAVKRAGVLVDYETVVSAGSLDFTSGTWLVPSPVYCDYLTVRGGAIVKFAQDATIEVQGESGPTCYTSAQSPAVFSCVDDNSIGDDVSGDYNNGTISPNGYANPAFYFDCYWGDYGTFSHCQFRYAKVALGYQCWPDYPYETVTVSDCQFTNCVGGIRFDGGSADWDCGVVNVYLDNVIMSGVPAAIDTADDDTCVDIWAYYCTFNGSGGDYLIRRGYWSYITQSFYSSCCVFANLLGAEGCDTSGYYNGFFNYAYSTPFGDSCYNLTSDPLWYPVITLQPSSQTVQAGGTATFTTTAIGVGPVGYQWRKQGGGGTLSTSTALTLTSVQATNAGYYLAHVSEPYGELDSTAAYLTVNTPAAAGLPGSSVSWWRAEDNAYDSIGTNHGTTHNSSYASGKVGDSFTFNGSNAYVEVPNTTNLRLTNVLTIELWVKRLRADSVEILVEKGGDLTGSELNYEVNLHNSSCNYMLQFNFSTWGWRGAGSISDMNWHHCAVVVTNGQADPAMYIDGALQTITSRGGNSTITLNDNTRPLHIGAQLDPQTGWNYYSQTAIDELTIYNRGLSASEIQAIYQAGSLGKCLPPVITNQPSSLTVAAGSNVTFSVRVSGGTPLSYQWTFNGSSMAGATGSSYSTNNVQAANAGNYAVAVTNVSGSVTSSTAVLTVLVVPDAWYSQHGLSPPTPWLDPDWDGLLNWQEYRYGTDPVVSEGFGVWVSSPSLIGVP